VNQCQPSSFTSVPSTFVVLNAATLTKPFALEHLTATSISNWSEVAVILETHFEDKHTNEIVRIDGYTLHCRDPTGRRGGEVAAHV
jgi:hypothetical protein